MRPVLHRKELPVLQPPENLTLNYDNSDFDEDHGLQRGDNIDCDLTVVACMYFVSITFSHIP